MDIKSAKYGKMLDKQDNTNIIIELADGKQWSVPTLVGNRHYDEIQKQVAAGTLTIKDAD